MGVFVLGVQVFRLQVQFFAVAARTGRMFTHAAASIFKFDVFSAMREISSSINLSTLGYLVEDVSIALNFLSILSLSGLTVNHLDLFG